MTLGGTYISLIGTTDRKRRLIYRLIEWLTLIFRTVWYLHAGVLFLTPWICMAFTFKILPQIELWDHYITFLVKWQFRITPIWLKWQCTGGPHASEFHNVFNVDLQIPNNKAFFFFMICRHSKRSKWIENKVRLVLSRRQSSNLATFSIIHFYNSSGEWMIFVFLLLLRNLPLKDYTFFDRNGVWQRC